MHEENRKQNRRNECIYILRSLCQSVAIALCDGAYVTSFMLFIGLNNQQISTINAGMNTAMFMASLLILLLYRWDKTGVFLVQAFSIGCILVPGSLLAAGLVSQQYAFILLLVLRFIASLMSSARNSAEINAVPILFGRQRYAYLLGVSGSIGGIFTLLASLGTMWLFRRMEEAESYVGFFGMAVILMIMYAVLSFGYRRLDSSNTGQAQLVSIRKMFSGKYLIKSIPHVVRGIGATGVVMFPMVVLSNVELTVFENTLLIPLSIVASIISSMLLTVISRYMKPGTIVMLGFLVAAFTMLTAPFITSSGIFMLMYSVLLTANTIASKSTMASVVYACEKEELSLMSSLHVLYYSLAYSPAMLAFGHYLDRLPILVMTLAAIFYAAGGILFHFFFRRGVEKDN